MSDTYVLLRAILMKMIPEEITLASCCQWDDALNVKLMTFLQKEVESRERTANMHGNLRGEGPQPQHCTKWVKRKNSIAYFVINCSWTDSRGMKGEIKNGMKEVLFVLEMGTLIVMWYVIADTTQPSITKVTKMESMEHLERAYFQIL